MLHVYARVLNDFYFRAKKGVGGWTKKVALAFLFISLSLSCCCSSSSTGLDWIDVLDRLGLRWGSRLYIFLLLVVHLLLLSLFSFLFRGREACIFSVPSTPQAVIHIQCAHYIYRERERRESQQSPGCSLMVFLDCCCSSSLSLWLPCRSSSDFQQISGTRKSIQHPSPPPSPPPLSMCPVYSRQQDL